MWILDEFENQLKKDIRDDNINGSLSAAIVQKNQIIWSNAIGPANINGASVADATTIYRVGSVTKSLTAFLMMLLVQDRIIELDGCVENYFQEIRGLEGYSDA